MNNEFPLDSYECHGCRKWSHFTPPLDDRDEGTPRYCAYCGRLALVWRTDNHWILKEITMGAHSFEDMGYGATAEEAFKDLCEQATYEEGHNPYNGTISTNDSFIMVPLQDGESLTDWRRRQWDNEDITKWGPCACVADPDEPVANGRTLYHFAGWAAC